MNDRLRTLLLVALPFALACPGFGDAEGNPVPAHPAYDPDVKAILDQHCTLCHVVPPHNGAPSGFRFDQYDDDANGNLGAFSMRCNMYNRAFCGAGGFMPPANQNQPPLAPNEKETIARWVEQGGVRTSGDPELPNPCAPCP